MNLRRESGDVVEYCDWCEQAIDRDNACYGQAHDRSSGDEITLTACNDDHLRWLQERFSAR